MNTRAAIHLGTCTNLIDGFNPAWDPSNPESSGLFETASDALERQVTAPSEEGEWDYPNITLHESAQSLLSELFPYKVATPGDEAHAPEIEAGPLLVGDADADAAKQKLSEALGVDLSNEGYRYALVRLIRTTGTSSHGCLAGGVIPACNPVKPDPALGVQEPFRSDMTRLRPGEEAGGVVPSCTVSTVEANQYLEMFDRYGTHFVSKVDFGDTIFQIFAYEEEAFDEIRRAYEKGKNPLSGPDASSFIYFTSDATTGAFGFVAGYGKVLSLTGSKTVLRSVERGEWKEQTFAGRDSVFAPFGTHAAFEFGTMDQLFTETGPIQYHLTSLAPFAEYKRQKLWQRIFKSAMVQKFPDGITPHFAKADSRDFTSMIPDYDEGLISTIATPRINTYKGRIDLSEMQFVGAEGVEQFTLLANVMQLSSHAPVPLPGGKITLAAQIFDMQGASRPAELRLGDKAYDTLTISCDEFAGALRLRNSSGAKSKTIVDGLVYELGEGGPEGRSRVRVAADVRKPLPIKALPGLVNGLEFSLAFGEAVIGSASRVDPPPLVELMNRYLLWLGRIIPVDSDDPALASIRMRAVELARVASDPDEGAFVPVLPAVDYQQYVASILGYIDGITRQIRDYQREIARRKQAELIIDVAKTLNENIVESGQLLSKVVSANAAQSRQMGEFYDGIITGKKAQLAQQKHKVAELEAALNDARADVNVAVEAYKNAVKSWADFTAITFALNVATDLFKLGVGMAKPASAITAVKSLGLTVQRIQKFLDVIGALHKLYQDASGVEKLKKANETLSDLDGMVTLAGVKWDEMAIDMKAILATSPSGDGVSAAKAELERTFALMVLRGKAWASAKGAVHTIEREIYLNQQRKAIDTAQAERLAELDGYLRPAKIDELQSEQIDLAGLTGALLFQRHQMMGMLAKAFVLQDQAMQYANLQPATPLASFNLLRFRGALAQQQSAAIEAKTELGRLQAGTTKPIEVRVSNVPVSQLTNGEVLRFPIGLDHPQFLEYVNARVKAVVAKVTGITGTNSCEYLVSLRFEGNPFFDRDPSRQQRAFHTPSRQRTYEYDVEGNRPRFTDEGESWSDGVSPITPFGSWEVALPKVEKNRGITFSDTTVEVTLCFILDARINDEPISHAAQASAKRHSTGGAGLLMASAVGQGSGPSHTELLKQMAKQGSALNGWDVIFNLSLSQINKALREQFDALMKDPEFTNTIHVEIRTEPSPGVEVVKTFDMAYGYPALQFKADQPLSVNLTTIITRGKVESCSYYDGKKLSCETVELGADGEALRAVLPLSKVVGSASGETVLDVSLEMTQGTFKAKNIKLDDVEKLKFNEAVVAYFAQNPVTFTINSLNLANVATLPALKPSEFLFKTLVPATGSPLLQLFITTAGRPALDHSQTFVNNVPDPIPIGAECSLMISSKVFFQDVLPHSLNKKGWKLEGVSPKEEHGAWSARYVNGSIGGTVDLSAVNVEYSVPHIGYLTSLPDSYHRQTVTIPGGNRVNWSVEDMAISLGGSGAMKLAYEKDQTIAFHVEKCENNCGFECARWKCGSSDEISTVRVSLNATLPLSISGTGRKQQIAIAIDGKSVNLTGHMSGGGLFNCDDLKALLNQQLRAQLPEQIKEQVNAGFDPISVFALKNLLFPSGNRINLESADVPGDVLITGTFVKEDG